MDTKHGKNMISTILAAALCLGLHAAATPGEVRYETQDGVPVAVCTYEIAPGEDPQDLVQQDFVWQGISYAFDHFETEPIYQTESRESSKLVQVRTDSPDFAAIRAQLKDSLEQEEDGYSGTLQLDWDSLETVPEDVQPVERMVSAVRQYPGLPSNDTAAIPSAIQDQGTTLTLTGLTWAVEASKTVSGIEFPARWTATATYTGKTTVQQAGGYITSAVYRGTLTRQVLSGIRVSLTYIGTPVPATTLAPTVQPTVSPTVQPTVSPAPVPTAAPTLAPSVPAESAPAETAPVPEPELSQSGMPLPARIGCAALVLAVLVSMGAVLHQVLRYNLKIYRQVGGRDRYILAGRYRVSESNPTVHLREHIPMDGTLVAALDGEMAQKLQGKEIALIAEDRLAVHVVKVDPEQKGAYWFRAVFGPGKESV